MNTKPITPAQLKKIQTMFTRIGFDKEDKMDVISNLTNGRATSTKDITFNEATRLIIHFSGKSESQKAVKRDDTRKEARDMVRCIYRIAYDIGMCYGDTPEDKLMNCAKINKFCRERGTVKKNITEMTLPELKKTKKQFEAILKNTLESAVNKLVKQSLTPKAIKKNERISTK